MIETINPTTGETIERYEEHDAQAVDDKLVRAWSRWEDDWQHRPLDERLEVLSRTAKVLDARRDELAHLIATEMGKPIKPARGEVEKCAWLCRHYAEHSPAYLSPEPYDTDAERSYVRFDPLGPIFAVMPWNFPLWQVMRFIVPNIAVGNVGLLKHSRNTTGCALAIEDVLAEAGLPAGGFAALLIGHRAATDVIADRRIRGVTLTGSDVAGRSVAASAGEHLKKTVLELGGSDPCIVLDDADLDQAAKTAVASRYLNSGQSCINAKRMIVHRDVYDAFTQAFVAEVDALAVGDPTDEDTDVGPLARSDLRDDVHEQVQRTLDHPDGGTLLRGAEKLEGPGFFYAPTVLRDVDPRAPSAVEEVFGPVASIIRADDEDDAVRIANDSRYGLGSAVWTTDLGRGERIAGRIESGMVFINELVKSDPRLPFGGVKDSGYGRELSGQGMREFTNAKTVWVNASTAAGGGVE